MVWNFQLKRMGIASAFGKFVSYIMGVLLVLILYKHVNDMAAKQSLANTIIEGVDGYLILGQRVSWFTALLTSIKSAVQQFSQTPFEGYIWKLLQYSLALGLLNFKRQFLLHFLVISSVIILNIPKSFQDADLFFAEQAQNILILGLTGYVSSL